MLITFTRRAASSARRPSQQKVCVCVRACVRARVSVYVCVCGGPGRKMRGSGVQRGRISDRGVQNGGVSILARAMVGRWWGDGGAMVGQWWGEVGAMVVAMVGQWLASEIGPFVSFGEIIQQYLNRTNSLLQVKEFRHAR